MAVRRALWPTNKADGRLRVSSLAQPGYGDGHSNGDIYEIYHHLQAGKPAAQLAYGGNAPRAGGGKCPECEVQSVYVSYQGFQEVG
jgi:hypothetical protein